MDKNTVSIVIPNYNGKSLLEKNLPSVIKLKNNFKNHIAEILVIDDNSGDDSVTFLKKNYPDIKLLKHKINRGFSASVNTGARMAKGDFIFLLNNDVLPSENCLENIFKIFDDRKVFAVSLHEKGFFWAKGNFADGYIQLSMGSGDNKTHRSFYVSGGSGVFRRTVWMELGGMDEKLLSPFYWEDIDLCYRAEKRGYINLWYSDGIVEHHHESTIGKMPQKYVQEIKERNQLLVIWKNIHSPKLIRNHIFVIIKRALAHPGYFKIILMAFKKINIVLSERKKEIKNSKVSDEAVFMQYN